MGVFPFVSNGLTPEGIQKNNEIHVTVYDLTRREENYRILQGTKTTSLSVYYYL